MLLVKVIRSIKGYVIFSASGGFIERLINLIIRNNINVWDIEKKDGIFYLHALAKDYKKIAELSKRIQVKIKVVERIGIMFLVRKYKKRIGILIGIGIFTFALIFMQNFIWSIEVIGNKNIPTDGILSKIEELGIKKGKFIPSLDFKEIQQKAIIEFEDIAWISINNVGTKISVEISESIKAPEINNDKSPQNIKAKKSGTIVRMNVLEGEDVVKVGETVFEGDLVVSGMFQDIMGNTLIKHSKAEVIARTNYTSKFVMKFLNEEKVYNNKEKNRYILDIFGIKLPLYLATKVKGNYDILSNYSQLELFGNKLPFGMFSNNYKFYNIESVTLNEEEAKEKLQEQIKEYENENFESQNISIIDREINEIINENEIIIEINYICEEDIALEEEILLN